MFNNTPSTSIGNVGHIKLIMASCSGNPEMNISNKTKIQPIPMMKYEANRESFFRCLKVIVFSKY